MTTPSPREVSVLLRAWRGGEKSALDQLMPLVYEELRRLAHRYMIRERAGHSLQTTALVNEAYMRLVDLRRIEWQDRAHFFAIAASFMRRILVDHARSRGYRKRGGDARKVSLDEALTAFAALDARKARVVELRFFGGLTEEETAEVLRVSRETVKRDWRLAKVWLLCERTDGVARDEAGTVAADRTDP